MKTTDVDGEFGSEARKVSSVTGSQRRTLEAIFRHPSTHSLEWSDILALIGTMGDGDQNSNAECVFEVAGKRLVMLRPRTKQLASAEVNEIRHFLMQAEVSPDPPPRHD